MTRFWFALCVFLCASPAFAQDAKQPTPAELQATIVKLEKEVVDLFQKRKTAELQKLLADDFVEVTSEGRRGKAAVFKELDAARDEPLDETVVELSDEKLTLVTPDAALLTYQLTIKDAPAKAVKPDKSEPKAPPKKDPAAKGAEKAPADDAPEAVIQHISSLWVKRNGRWLNVFYQSTPDSSDAEAE